MSSSSSSSGNSQQQQDSPKHCSIETIIYKLNQVHERLQEDKTPRPASTQAEHAVHLEKVRKEVEYMIREFEKLKKFEDDLIHPLETLQDNVNDILKDLNRSSNASLNQIERNLKVLRSNITKVKIQIPLQHQASGLISDASRYLQATVASREAGDLPNLYAAAKILDERRSTFLKAIKDKYDGLKEDRLKLCLLCFAVFPENAEVKQSLLRFWWIGERLAELPLPEEKDKMAEDPDSKEKVEMDRVNKILDVLVKEGFIDPVQKKSRLSSNSYTMHPIVRSLLIKLAKEADFFDYDNNSGNPTNIFTVSDSKKKTCLIKTEYHWLSKKQQQQQNQNPKNQQKSNSEKQPKENQGKQQQNYLEEQQKYLAALHSYLANLQTVVNINTQFPDLPVEEFSKMRSVYVLYLGRWERTAERHMEIESTDFLKGLENMKKLRFFSLQGISGIETLPDSVCKLMNLRILDLRACHNLVELPKQLGSLKKLVCLDMSECYLIDNMPKQLALLSELLVLKGFVINKSRRSCTLHDLTVLRKLKKLSINVNNKAFSIDEDGKVLSKFGALQKLRIAWGAEGEGSSKSTHDDKVKSEAKPNKSGSKGEKKINGHQESKRQHNGASKSVATTALQKLKMPWGGCGEGSSESAGKKRETAAKENSRDDNKTPVFKKLEKLDLQCFPRSKPPSWLVPGSLRSLKSLYIRGGKFSYLEDISEENQNWQVEILRLKYLGGVQISWKDLQTQFPNLKYLERVKCPGITFCPCDADGVWQLKSSNI